MGYLLVKGGRSEAGGTCNKRFIDSPLPSSLDCFENNPSDPGQLDLCNSNSWGS